MSLGRAPAAALASVLAVACGSGEGGGGRVATVPLTPGRVVAAEPVECFASADWDSDRRAVGEAAWSFRGVADLVCHVAAPPAGPLVFRLTPAAASRGSGLRARWDERPLAAVDAAADDWTFAVPAEALDAGRHVLTLERVVGPGGEAGGGFDRLAWSVAGGAERALSPDARQVGAFVSDFLLHGVAGRGRELAGGVLFIGPGALALELPAGARRLLARPENSSSTLARFAATACGAAEPLQVVPGSRGELALDLPADCREVRLGVEGAADGAFLWGGLRVERRSAAGEEAPGRPPIVLVSLDTTRRDALGAYGGGPTPHLDAFAERATVYAAAAATSPWTLPSHASMMTGLYPGRHGAGVHHRSLRGAAPTLAEALAGAGYVSAGVAGGHLVSHRFGIGRGFSFFHDPQGFESPGAQVTYLAERELERLAAGGPFLLFVHYFDPHFPYAAPLGFRRRADEPAAAAALAGLADWPEAASGDIEAWRALLDRPGPVPDAARRWLERAYGAEVAHVDAQVGRLLAALDRRGLLDPALVVVTADHGELLGEGDRLSHAFGLEPELVEIPMLVKWPGQRAGRRDDRLASLVDLFPTLLAAAGVAAPPSDGVSLAAGRGAGTERHVRLLFEEHESRIHPLAFRRLRIAEHLYGVASAGQRRVVWPGGGDCAERQGGRWRSHPCPDEGAALFERLRDFLGGAPASGAAGEISDEERAHLRALGYL